MLMKKARLHDPPDNRFSEIKILNKRSGQLLGTKRRSPPTESVLGASSMGDTFMRYINKNC